MSDQLDCFDCVCQEVCVHQRQIDAAVALLMECPGAVSEKVYCSARRLIAGDCPHYCDDLKEEAK